MEPYDENAALKFNLKNHSDDWLRKRQGLALPVLPPTTLEARKYFFAKIRWFAALASESRKSKVDFEAFAREWNQMADGKDRFYVSTEVLAAYAKTWEKTSNIRASQELVSEQLDHVRQTANIFVASQLPFPSYLTHTSVPWSH